VFSTSKEKKEDIDKLLRIESPNNAQREWLICGLFDPSLNLPIVTGIKQEKGYDSRRSFKT
jgi:hypothetical protein